MRGGGVAEALVPPPRRRGRRHRRGCHRDGILRGGVEKAGVLCVFGASCCTEVHLIGTTQESTTLRDDSVVSLT